MDILKFNERWQTLLIFVYCTHMFLAFLDVFLSGAACLPHCRLAVYDATKKRSAFMRKKKRYLHELSECFPDAYKIFFLKKKQLYRKPPEDWELIDWSITWRQRLDFLKNKKYCIFGKILHFWKHIAFFRNKWKRFLEKLFTAVRRYVSKLI